MANIEESHWIELKQIFHYLKGTLDFGQCFRKNIKYVIMGLQGAF
jgi:hypothetical protein